MISWLLETLLGFLLVGLTVAGAYEVWQNRRSPAALLHSGVAIASSIVGLFVVSTWPWRWINSIAHWLINWLVPHLVKWVFEFVEFLILTVLVEIVTTAWDFLPTLSGNFFTLPLLVVLAVWCIYLGFMHQRDRQRFRNMESGGSTKRTNWSEAAKQATRLVNNLLKGGLKKWPSTFRGWCRQF